MAFGILEAIKGENGAIPLWVIPEFYDGLKTSPMIKGYLPPTTASNQNRQANYMAPWNDAGTDHEYWNEGIMQNSVQYNRIGRGAVMLNTAGSGVTSQTLTLRNGYTFIFQNASPQLTIKAPNNTTVQTYNSIAQSTNYYNNALYICIDYDAGEAFVGSIYWNPNYSHGGSRQYCGFYLNGLFYTATERQKLYGALLGTLFVPDPYTAGGISSEGGGGGGQTFVSDSVGEPSAPTLSPQGSRLLTLYKVDSIILKDFANYLWAGGIDFATLHNIFNDTMGAVISLAVCPFTPDGNTPQNLWFGNFDSGVSATLVDSQYDTVDCGTISLDEEYKSALDYNPYCKIELCLPYCGNVALDPDEFMGTDVSIKYKIDLLTGACIACVFADSNLMLTVPGNVLASVPVTNADHKSIVSSVAGTAISVAGAALAVATGGMSAPAAATTAATATAANTLNMKERYSHGGTGNANTALLGPQKPYVIIKWPRQCLPLNNNKYQGYPSMITTKLSDLYGFTQVHKIHLDGISATQTEMMELEAALREGVIL